MHKAFGIAVVAAATIMLAGCKKPATTETTTNTMVVDNSITEANAMADTNMATEPDTMAAGNVMNRQDIMGASGGHGGSKVGNGMSTDDNAMDPHGSSSGH